MPTDVIDNWYLLRAKFTNDSYFLVRELGRWRGMEECSLEIAEVLLGVGRGVERDVDRKPVCKYFGKRIAKVNLVYVF